MRYLKLLFWPIRMLIGWLRQYYRGHDSAAGQRRRQAQRHASMLLAELARLGFARRVVVKRGKSKYQRTTYQYPLLLTQNELWLPIKQSSLPLGRTTDELRADPIVQSLEDRLNAGVRVDYLATGQFCYVVRLGGDMFPEKFSLNTFQMPPDAPALTLPFGVDRYGDHVPVDLVNIKHLLIAGATGGGKTTLFHSMITTLISRNDADNLELWLVDMKRTEFSLYRTLMGKKGATGVVRHIAVDPEDAIDVLSMAYKEITQRNQHMERLGVTSISDLETSTGQRLKRIILMIDEFAILTMDSTRVGKQTIGSWSKLLMTRIAALGRSAGVSICIATQMVKKEVIDGMISANFENRIAFSCATWRESNLVVQSSEAVGLPDGRAILRVDGKTKEVQTCFVTPGQVKLEIARVAEFGPDGGLGDEDTKRFVRDAKLLIDMACSQLGGDFARAKLLALEGIRGVISWDAFDEIARRLERDGIVEPGGPRKPRRVTRAFFGRPNLLDQFYGVIEVEEGPPRGHSVIERKLLRGEVIDLRGERQEAEKDADQIDVITEYGGGGSDASTNEKIPSDEINDSDSATLPPEFQRLFADLDEKATSKKKKRKPKE